MNLRTRKNLILSLLILAGCSVGPDYERPEMPLPENYPATGADSTGGDSEILGWWRTFDDPVLDRLIAKGIENNQDVKIALGRLNEARALRRRAFSEFFPGGQVSAGHTSVRLGAAQAPGLPPNLRRVDSYDVGFDALWEIDIFGGLRRNYEANQAEEEAREAEVDEALRTLLSEVARNYFELRGSQESLRVAQANVKNQSETVELTENLFKYGEVTELDTARARAQLSTTEATVPSLQGDIEASVRRISVLLGQNPSELVTELSEAAPLPLFRGPVKLGKPAELLRRRPDVRAAERRLAEANAEVGVAVAEFFPKVEFNGSFAIESSNFGDLSESGHERYSFGPRISWTGLNFTRTMQLKYAADARAEVALYEYEKSVLSALEDAENAMVYFSKEKERNIKLARSAADNRRAFDLARLQYKEGQIDFLSVLDSQRATLLAEEALSRSSTATLVNLVAVYKALGGGWEDVIPSENQATVGSETITTPASDPAPADDTVASAGL
jgi:outer membrane protein, multidrug efflux system